jgi:Tol biopolymer transport system component
MSGHRLAIVPDPGRNQRIVEAHAMTASRTRGTLTLWLTLTVAACQGSGGIQPTPSPSGASSPAPPTTSEPTATPEITTNPADIPPGLILFHRSGSDGVERYFTINTDGTDEQALYEAEGCGCAHWSADWTQVLSIGPTGHDTWSLLTIDPDGSNQAVIDPPIETLNLFVGASSADGRVIAFQGMDETDPTRNGLYVASPDLSNVRLVTPLLEGWRAVEPFGVTPDESKIVLFADTGPDGDTTHAGDIYVINTDGSGLRQLNPPGTRTGYLGMPVISLSPDGRQAAFGLDDAVWVVDLDGGEVRQITTGTGFVWAVAWSPIGEWITYTRFHGSTSVVALVRPDGTDDHEISGRDETDEANAAVWSPDGKYLLVPRDGDSLSDELRDLWTMDRDGNFIAQVTHEPATYGTYSWAPAPGS